MATPTKTRRELIASVSNAAGASKTDTYDLTGALDGAMVTVIVTNGATGPTLPCNLLMETAPSESGDTFAKLTDVDAKLGNNVVTSWNIPILDKVMFLKTTLSGNTDEAVTVEVLAQELTSIQ